MDCNLAVESTMIFHSPEVKEQLLRLGIPVLTEHTSYEAHPLGRVEWIKLYGLIAGKEREAESFFDEQVSSVEALLRESQKEKKDAPVAAFFYVTSDGAVNVRKKGDYIVKMIELSGGKYFLPGEEKEDENALSSVNLQMEEFYASGRDADGNGTAGGGCAWEKYPGASEKTEQGKATDSGADAEYDF